MPLYLGLDSSTQSLGVVVLEITGARRRVVLEDSIDFDSSFPRFGTRHGVLPHDDPAIAVSSPVLWAEALDAMMARLAASGLDLGGLAAVSGSAQQHGSVYLNAGAADGLAAMDAAHPPGEQVRAMLSRPIAPIWMDSSTSAECAELTSAIGADALTRCTGSRACERFTGPQIRKFFKQQPAAYAATDRVHLVSSFLASLLVRGHAPVDTGDASGTNLLELASGRWWPAALDATAPGLAEKLPSVARPWTVAGTLSPYWQRRHRLPPAMVIVWSGDNPCSLIGTGLVREGRVAISLGTSDTIFGPMDAPRPDERGTGHVFAAPTGAFMGLTCLRNGSLARERVRDAFGMTWEAFAAALDATPAGNHGRLLLPWFEPEITPVVPVPGVRRYGVPVDDGPANVRGVVEAQQMALALHSRWMNVTIDTIHATGGAAANRSILQVMADVFGADVYQFEVRNSAALGAALRAYHGDETSKGRAIGWDEVVRELAEPRPDTRLRPDAARHAVYLDLLRRYEKAEEEALR